MGECATACLGSAVLEHCTRLGIVVEAADDESLPAGAVRNLSCLKSCPENVKLFNDEYDPDNGSQFALQGKPNKDDLSYFRGFGTNATNGTRDFYHFADDGDNYFSYWVDAQDPHPDDPAVWRGDTECKRDDFFVEFRSLAALLGKCRVAED